jgi:hypothetical protein
LAEERLGKDVDEFCEVLKVLGHLGGQHHVDDTLPNDFVVFSVQSFNVKNFMYTFISFLILFVLRLHTFCLLITITIIVILKVKKEFFSDKTASFCCCCFAQLVTTI